MKTISYCFSLGLFILLTSCASKKDVLLLQNLDPNSSQQLTQQYASKLQPGDILTINVSSTDNIGVAPFNVYISAGAISGDAVTSRQRLANYTIAEDGTVQFPILGTLNIAGKTTLETKDYLESLLKKYLKEPIVMIEWLNFKYTVLGTVTRPGQFISQSQKVTILDALGNAGDLEIYANRKNVLVIRENNGEQHYYSMDLTQKEFMNSEGYYIKQNDVILVSPNNAQIQSSAYNRNTPIFVSVASLLLSVIILITR